jgi:hypothetical protein
MSTSNHVATCLGRASAGVALVVPVRGLLQVARVAVAQLGELMSDCSSLMVLGGLALVRKSVQPRQLAPTSCESLGGKPDHDPDWLTGLSAEGRAVESQLSIRRSSEYS